MGKGAPAGLSKDEEIARLGEELQAHELMVKEEGRKEPMPLHVFQ